MANFSLPKFKSFVSGFEAKMFHVGVDVPQTQLSCRAQKG